jgi:hypothetical protein
LAASADRRGQEAHRVARFQPQQNGSLACAARLPQRVFDLGGRFHGFAVDLKDDVAQLESALGPEPFAGANMVLLALTAIGITLAVLSAAATSGEAWWRNPITGIAGCCALPRRRAG